MNTTAQPPTISFTPVTSGLSSTVDVVNAGDGSNRLFIVERVGIIRVYKNGALLPTPFMDIHDIVGSSGSEQGMLSIAFHPNYETNGFFYVYYNNLAGDVTVARYSVSGNPDIALSLSGVTLLSVPKPFPNHNGGKLNFGPDGYLYFGLGDGGGGGDPQNLAQRRDTLLGKMVRINVTNEPNPPYYSIPADNPYVDSPGVKKEIWAMGLRNPWRWSFDRLTGDMWIADVGESTREEVNFVPNGSTGGVNYGWRCYEGSNIFNTSSYCGSPTNTIFPVFTYGHNSTTGGFAITGGYVSRNTLPENMGMYGYYIFSDYISGNGWVMNPQTFVATRSSGWPQFSSFGEGENGVLYALALNGTLYRVVATGGGPLPVNILSFAAVKQNGNSLIKWTTSNEVNTQQFELEKSTDGMTYVKVASIPAGNSLGNYSYTDNNNNDVGSMIYYRLRIVDNDGSVQYSSVAKIVMGSKGSRSIYPNVINDGMLNIYTDAGAEIRSVQVTNSSGTILLVKQVNSSQLNHKVRMPSFPAGIYFVRLIGNNSVSTERIVIK